MQADAGNRFEQESNLYKDFWESQRAGKGSLTACRDTLDGT